ncbi:MAG: cobyrinate a,c-diamide synthase [Microcoleaceae cyanobacterium]
MTLVIAGDRSSAGKTTVTLALLSYLKQQGLTVQFFKVVPDYIDPMFHQAITQIPCYNLDPILTSEAYIQRCFGQHIQSTDFAVVEGVMGLFDGVPDQNSRLPKASTAQIAQLLDLPILLVVDCSRLSGSIAAIVHGLTTLNHGLKFAGCILNRVGSDRHLELLQSALDPLGIPILGVLKRQVKISIPSRHLGLIPSEELSVLQTTFDRLAHLAKQWFDWERLLPLRKTENSIPLEIGGWETQPLRSPGKDLRHPDPARIGVARDKAFNFYYADNLATLQSLGAELVFWSPLQDTKLPNNLDGLYLGGGFPEVFAEELSQNTTLLQQVKQTIQSGIPVYAECGGLMYLSEAIIDFDQKNWPMVGILPTATRMGQRLKLGYYQAKVLKSSPLLKEGHQVCGHQFHRSELTLDPDQPLLALKRYSPDSMSAKGKYEQDSYEPEGWCCSPKLHASYLHLHWGDRLEIPQRFIQSCQVFRMIFWN